MAVIHTRRRTVISLFSALSYTALPSAVYAALTPTPKVAEGPFYPTELPLDRDNDLTRVQGASAPAQGLILDLAGRVLDRDGKPVANAAIEIWQCNAFGRYHHPGDTSNAPLDPGFQGFGRMVTDSEGRYRFRTIKPVPYPGRAPHIHFKVTSRNIGTLTSQMFVAGEPGNERDGLYRWLRGDEARSRVTATLAPAPEGSGAVLRTEFDVVLGA